jgi:hypothetical protein
LNTGLTAEKAKGTIEGLSGKRQAAATTETINFSRGVRRTFEIASNVSPARLRDATRVPSERTNL